MNILVLHGPSLNLIGAISAQIGQRITLDKINTGLRRHVRNSEINLKIMQTHKIFQAINFIQRNRNWADGILFAPMAWAKYEHSIVEALQIADIPTIQLLFSDGFSDIDKDNSVFSDACKSTINGPPDQVYIDGINALQKLA